MPNARYYLVFSALVLLCIPVTAHKFSFLRPFSKCLYSKNDVIDCLKTRVDKNHDNVLDMDELDVAMRKYNAPAKTIKAALESRCDSKPPKGYFTEQESRARPSCDAPCAIRIFAMLKLHCH
jgi:hypothetical protein